MKLGVYFFGSIYEPTGAGKVVRSFAESEQLFAQHGIQLDKVYSLDIVRQSKDHFAKPSLFSKFKNLLVNNARLLLEQTAIGSYMVANKLYFIKGEQIVEQTRDRAILNDALIFHDLFTFYAYINKVPQHKNQKLVLILHTNGEVFKMMRIDYPHIVGTKYDRKYAEIEIICLDRASKIVFVSQLSANNFIANYPQYRDKVEVVYNGIKPSGVQNGPVFDGEIRAVTVGTVNARKNQALLVEAIGKLKNKVDIHLTVVGGGDQLELCKMKAQQMGISDIVSFLGSRSDVEDILLSQNLFVMTSLDEGLPIAAIEALKAKLPVILTDVGGNKELIEDNGYLITPKLADVIAAIEDFAKDINNQKIKSTNSYTLFQNRFVQNKMIEGYSRIVKEQPIY